MHSVVSRVGGRHEVAVGRDDAVDARGGLLEQLLRGQAVVREPLDRVERALGGGEGRGHGAHDPPRAWRVRASSSRMIPAAADHPSSGDRPRRAARRASSPCSPPPPALPSPTRSTAPSCSPTTRATTQARSSFNLLVDQRPAAVAFPSDAREVADAVALARAPRPARRAAGDRPTTRRRWATWTICCSSTSAACRTSTSIPAPAACASAPASSGTASRRACRRTASPGCTAPRPTSASPATRSAAAWAGSRASTGCRPTPSRRSSS